MIKKRLPLTAQILTVLGLVFIVSWFLDIHILLQVFPDLPGIKFNSALLLAVAGICSWLWVTGKSIRTARILGLIILLIASVSIAQDFLKISFGIDELFVKDSIGRSQGSIHPGRMPGMTAIIYLLFGSAILFFTKRPPKLLAGQLLLHGISLLTFIALMGYLMRVPDFYTLSFLAGVSPSIALIWFIFSLLLTLNQPLKGVTGLLIGEKKGSALARKLTLRFILALIILSYIWIEVQRMDLIQVDFGTMLFAISFLIVGLILIWDSAAWLNTSDEKRALAENELLLTKQNLEKMVEIRNQELKGILDSAAVSIIATDKNGLIRHFSKGAERMLGYDAKEIVGKIKFEQFHVKDEVQAKASLMSAQTGITVEAKDVFTLFPLQGKTHSDEWNYLRKDGSTLPVQLNISQITSNKGKHLGFIGIATDISQLTTSRKQLKDLLDKLESKNRQLLNFAHIISHNLRSPVNSLDALINFYKIEEEEQEKAMLFGLVEEVIKNLLATMEETIDVLRVQEDTDQKIESVSLTEIFEKTKTALIGKIMEYGAEVDVDLSEVTDLDFSRSYLESIFLNLMSNSLKYRHPDRPPRLTIKSGIDQERPYLTFGDNGMGIDLKKHGEKVFGMNKTFHKNADAKGVGLYIVKTQLESLGGKISIQSQVNEGTTFRIDFR
ncbi:sensor histidine kinase [Algoriphagus terrigena]|uniref:sensor histidine kinase n=1 Tax=Algoriphagus terrigena TaxID=344884 RepID=UPI0006847ABB|nr:PAS domain-containing sensor histidine kinase [Algoriphagus terrigena]